MSTHDNHESAARRFLVHQLTAGWHWRLARQCSLDIERAKTRAGEPPVPTRAWHFSADGIRVFLTSTFAVLLWLAAPVVALAQLPADAVILEKVKIPEKQKSLDLCPVYLVPSEPKLPAWEYKGVKYRGSKPDARERFFKDPDKYAKAAEKQRFINNFTQAMSPVWCPVTDQVSAGGMTQWKRLGLTFESCCSFCDDNVKEEDFPEAVKRLKSRAEKTYALIGAKYTEGAKSPVEGAIRKPIAKTKKS